MGGGLRRRRQVRELGVALQEAELDRVGGAVAVLGEDHLGEPLRVGLLAVVVLVAVDERDEVGVLLDGVVDNMYSQRRSCAAPRPSGRRPPPRRRASIDHDLVPVDVALGESPQIARTDDLGDARRRDRA